MKAIVQTKFGSARDVLKLTEIDTPTPGKGEVLVKVHAAAIHIGDYYTIAGLPYVMRPIFSAMRAKNRVPGMDIAGTVEAVGEEVTHFHPGSEVFGSHKGAFAECACFPERSLALKPENLTFEQASTLGVSALTALQALRDQGKVQPGKKVLITGASGGVGTFAVQIAKALGAEVTGVCSTRNMEMVREIGADHVTDYSQEDFTEGDLRYDFILDNVSSRSLSETRRALSATGMLLANGARVGGWFGGLTDPIAALASSLVVRGQCRPFVSTSNPEDLAALKELAEAGKVTPVLDKSYRLDETPDAVTHVGDGHAQGKTVLTMEQAGA
jgi:NADPH:quinone reductase-like Zn-dependent oxidoreductase